MIQSHDPCDSGGMLYRLSYEALPMFSYGVLVVIYVLSYLIKLLSLFRGEVLFQT